MNVRLVILAFLVVDIPTANAVDDLSALLKNAAVTITERRVIRPEDEKYFPCKDFVKTSWEARAFLLNSKAITPHQQHYDFDVYHCEVSGRVNTKVGPLEFIIRMGGTGSVKYPDGKEVLLGCRGNCCKALPNIC